MKPKKLGTMLLLLVVSVIELEQEQSNVVLPMVLCQALLKPAV